MRDDTRMYTTDEYVRKNPSMHKQDSPWKIEKIRPVLDMVAARLGSTMTILDVGGGAGEILAGAADYLRQAHGKEVTKYTIDLTPAMLKEQVKTNPDIKKPMLGDIRQTTLADKESDVTLMIDVLEHVPDPNAALREIGRTSRYAVFKVPLEDNLYDRIYDARRKGALRKLRIEQIGHINVYSYSSLKRDLEQHLGRVVYSAFTNAAAYHLSLPETRKAMSGKELLMNRLASSLHHVSGRLASRLFCDFVVMLVECR
jgi:ubiquinone/menaquinone biosynthesis C-methylase UbiE